MTLYWTSTDLTWQKLAKELASADGCLGVLSPVLGKRALYERSGHLSKFSQDMFLPCEWATTS
ncbi:hypothetical protein [Rhodococcus sp. USK13]|uniref:hypothetical protein n=1 Tax=Rhodococcus sp. USK13 TaxID=2806442 RepID=UPI001BCF606F|nr:hypothetical protein [Rhodococcus sp. USK13]